MALYVRRGLPEKLHKLAILVPVQRARVPVQLADRALLLLCGAAARLLDCLWLWLWLWLPLMRHCLWLWLLLLRHFYLRWCVLLCLRVGHFACCC